MKSFISLLLIPFITGFINPAKGSEITLEKIFLKRTFSQKSVYGLNSMKNGIHYTVLENVEGKQQINKYDYAKGKMISTVLLNDFEDGSGEEMRMETYQFSADESMILISSNSERIYRHSRRSEYYIYRLSDKSLTQISTGKFQLADFSPDGKSVSYMRENNLFIFDITSGKEIAVTRDGVTNSIINGAPDWVYEEEFTLVKAYEWSPDSKYLAFYRFDETDVKEFSFPLYGTLYPKNYVYKYPKAGERNSKVEIHIFNARSGTSLKAGLVSPYEYIPRIKWTNYADLLSVQVMNREQNFCALEFVSGKNGKSKVIYDESAPNYLEVKDIIFLKDKSGFLWESEESGVNQVYHHKINSGANKSVNDYSHAGKEALTSSDVIVTDIIGLNADKNDLYLQICTADQPYNRQHIKVNTSSKSVTKLEVSAGTGRISASRGMKYFISYISSSEKPLIVTVHNEKGKAVRTLEENKALLDTLKSYNLSRKEFIRIKTDNGDLNAWILKPVNFQNDKKYPVLMYVYGGPGSQTVLNSWGRSNDMWYQYLAQKGYIIVSVDNRGTGNRGREFREVTYGQLGKLESEDQINAAKYLQSQPYVDASRIGIWGWSYGGYMSTLCLAKGNDVFKMAIAVAPVTNWRYYDSIYTERYMGLPSKNGESYDENSPINHVDKIKGKYLLVHGTADDNVHFQNTAEIIEALVQSNVDFDLGIYPNKNHGIYGGNTSYHLYNKMNNFILENL